ncbi:MAG: hypothetical protein XD60_0356 [Acetothermia bacterium 64_32]|nr:MAG: hypothetical protein XD60_0356 [Acetothermia bacterium 64_32]HAF71527.1 hypothetical protein [Candidatus Acetothermia bacterium]
MRAIGFWVYHAIWAVGAALVGLVIGFLVKTPPTAVSSVLLVIGLILLGLGGLWGRKMQRRG